jgi:hypothetical protein
VQRVLAVVDRQLVLNAVECEASFGDTIAVTADECAEVWMAF